MQPNAAGLPSVGNRTHPNFFKGKGRTKAVPVSVRREPVAHPHAAATESECARGWMITTYVNVLEGEGHAYRRCVPAGLQVECQ